MLYSISIYYILHKIKLLYSIRYIHIICMHASECSTIVEVRERGFIEHIPTVKGDQRLNGSEVGVGPEGLGLLDGARGVEYHTRLYTYS